MRDGMRSHFGCSARDNGGMNDTTALLIVDAQYGFMPGGGLPVAGGDAIVPVVNRVAKRFANVVLTQDWHPADHVSFAANHPGRQPFDTIALPYGQQVLWPTHCVQGTRDAALHDDLQVAHAQLIIRKGYQSAIDSYSAFVEADRQTTTGLAAYLQARAIDLNGSLARAWADMAAAGVQRVLSSQIL